MSPNLSLRPLQTQSDAKLVALAREGHERAFEALVRRYRRQLLVYANRLLGAEGRGEDVLQHALLQAWIALRADADVKDARAWLYRIVHNSAVSTVRRPRHDTVELNEALDASASDDGPESGIVVGEVLQSLASLPDLQRRALVLTAVGGDTHREAAATLGLTDGAVRGLVYRARSAMRDAATALLPVGPLHLATAAGSRRSPVGSKAADLVGVTGGAGSAGLAAVVLKGGAVVMTAGALATAGQQFAIPKLLGNPRPVHSAATAEHHLVRRLPGSASLAGVSSASVRLVTGSPASARSPGGGAFRGHVRDRGGAPGPDDTRRGSVGHSSRGSVYAAPRSGDTRATPGGSSPDGAGSAEHHGGSTPAGDGPSTATPGSGGSGPSRGDQPSGNGGSGGSDTSSSGPTSGSGSGSPPAGSGSSPGGSHDAGSGGGSATSPTDQSGSGGSTSSPPDPGASIPVRAPADVSGGRGGPSGSGSGTGSSGSGGASDPGSTAASGGSH